MEICENCPQCKKSLDNPTCRLVQDACGHKKCRLCLLNDEDDCKLCKESAETKKEILSFPTAVICQNKTCDDNALPPNKETTDKNEAEINQSTPSHISVSAHSQDFTCNICKKTFTTRSHIKYHFYCSGAKKPFQCDICKKEFIVKSHLQTHILSHQNLKPYSCDKCDKKFFERSKLNRHKLVHANGKSFICQECGKSFKNKENLRTHSIIHRPEKPYKCMECSAKFSHSSNLKKHIQTHQSEKSHMCDQCGKRFKLKWALTVHRRSHLKIRPNECRTCTKAFVHAKDLQRHELIHLDAKGFTCGICGTSFKRKDNLNRHTKNTHPGKKPSIIKNPVKQKLPQENKIVDTPNAINVITASPSLAHHKETSLRENDAPRIVAPLKLAYKTDLFKNNYKIHRDNIEPKIDLEPDSIYEKILLPSSPNPKNINNNLILKKEMESNLICQQIWGTPGALHYKTSFHNKKNAVIKNMKFKLPAEYTKLKTKDKLQLQPPARENVPQVDHNIKVECEENKKNVQQLDLFVEDNKNMLQINENKNGLQLDENNVMQLDENNRNVLQLDENNENVLQLDESTKKTYVELQNVTTTSVIVNANANNNNNNNNNCTSHWRRRTAEYLNAKEN